MKTTMRKTRSVHHRDAHQIESGVDRVKHHRREMTNVNDASARHDHGFASGVALALAS